MPGKSIQQRRRVGIIVVLILFITGTATLIHYRQNRRASLSSKEKSIVIIPFINADSNKENDYISDGLTGEIEQRLSGISGLRLVSANQVRVMNIPTLSPVEIGRRLKAASVLSGNIKKTGPSLSIHIDLTDAGSGDKIWSRDFETNTHELFSFQNELARVISEELHTEISVNEKNRLDFRPTQNLEAYDQYLKGIYFWNKRDAKSLRRGIEFFNQAIVLDSNYVSAWCGLADCYSALGYGSHDAPSVDFMRAEMAARKALSLDSTLAAPHTSLGYIEFYYYWDWEKAEKEFLTAIRLNQNYPLAHDAYAYFLTAQERFAEAGVEMEKASALDPASAFIQTDRGFALYYAGNYERSIPSLKDVLIRYPGFPLAWLWLGRSYQEIKNYPESIDAYTKALKKDSVWPVALAAKGFVLGISGNHAESEKILLQLKDLSAHRYVTPYGMALIYAGLKQKDKTFEWLNQAYAERTNWLVWLKLDPRWAFIKNDPRYIALIEKTGLNHRTEANPKN